MSSRGRDDEPLPLLSGAKMLLDRQAATDASQAILGREYELLYAELRRGIRILNRVANVVPASAMRDSSVALLWLYLEALDGVDMLVRGGAIGPAEILARTMVEDGLQLLYLLQKNDERVARAYSTDRIRRNRNGFEKLVEGSLQRRELLVEASRSRMNDSDFWRRYPDTAPQVAELCQALSQGQQAVINTELDSLRKRAPWYAAFAGSHDLIEVARALKMEPWHRMLYAPWSDRVHGCASNTVFVIEEDGATAINTLRNVNEWQSIVVHCHALNLLVFNAVTTRFDPEAVDELAVWTESANDALLACLARNGALPSTGHDSDGSERP